MAVQLNRLPRDELVAADDELLVSGEQHPAHLQPATMRVVVNNPTR